jgi:cobaltochelatase CobS
MNPTLFGQPMKKKPRGRPFARGEDHRRRGTIEPVGEGKNCPLCVADGRTPGTMQAKHGQYGRFLGCTEYPTCRYTEKGRADHATRTTSEPTEPTTAPSAQEPEPMLSAPLPTTSAPGTLDAIVAQIARAAAADSINEPRVRTIVTEMTSELRHDLTNSFLDSVIAIVEKHSKGPSTVKVQVNDAPIIEIEGKAHAKLREIIGLAVARFNILLVGPAGCGKTTLGEQLAASLGRSFATLSCAPGLPESAFVGRMIPNLTDGTERYRTTPFVEAYRNGGVFMADEIDNADASTLLVINSALANGHMTLPSGERIERHADFVFIGSANTYGHGQSREYVGRTQLDAAFLDRFVGATLTLDYDRDLETALCPDDTLRETVWRIRDETRRLKLRRVVSTRALVSAFTLKARMNYDEFEISRRITEGWTVEDRRACGVPTE